MTESRLGQLRRRVILLLIAGVGAIAATVISLGLAVYAAAHPKAVPQFSFNQPIETGRWTITIRDAAMIDGPPFPDDLVNAGKYLALTFDADNRSASATELNSLNFSFDPPIDGLPYPQIYLARDRARAGPLNPNMPERVVMAWAWPAGVPVPDDLNVLVRGQVYKARDNLYGMAGWLEREPVARIDVALGKGGTR